MVRNALIVVSVLAASCAPALRGGPGHPRWRAAGDGPSSSRMVVGSRYDPTGRVDGYFQGDRRISLDRFLRVTGHHAHADRMATRRWVKPTLIGVGAGVIVAGVVYAFAIPTCTYPAGGAGSLDEYNRCLQDRNDGRLLGGGIGVVGAGLTITGLVLGSGRPAEEELRYWAAEHNRIHDLPPIAAASARVRVGAAIDRDGAGLVVRGRF